jgi:UDPglucose--hexose-1-phosphate uridylyltransferase
VRVVANIYPLATEGAAVDPVAGGVIEAARGAHEVVVEHPKHDVDMADYDDAHLSAVLRVYRDRVAALSSVPGVASVAAFRNRGRRAGSSQPHPHGQIVAIPVQAPRQAKRHALARAHHQAHGETLLDALLRDELRAEHRVVEERRGFVAWVPFAARQNHHVRIAMNGAAGGFGAITDETIAALADVLGRTLVRVRAATGDAPYNLLFESPPVSAEGDAAAFWYVDVLPRRGGHAGFELGSGIEVVTVLPEGAAEELRVAPF